MSRKETDTYSLTSVFGTVAFGGMPLDYFRHLLAVAFIGSFPEIPKDILRHQVQLDLAPDQPMDKQRFESIVLEHYPPYKSNFGPNSKSKSKSEKDRMRASQKKKYDGKKKRDVNSLCGVVIEQWPCENLKFLQNMEAWQAKAFNECNGLFKKCMKNVKLYGLVQTVQTKLDTLVISPRPNTLFPTLPGRLQIDPRSAASWSPPDLPGFLITTNAPCPMDVDENSLQDPEAPGACGNQQNVNGESDRWDVIQDVFNLIGNQAKTSRQEVPNSLDIEKLGWPRHAREGALKFISSLKIEKVQEDTVRRHFENSIILKKLLVLRGLFGHPILQFALAGKRWLVEHEVDSDRCLMAVPFRAKGVPSANSEFGLTDVALTLTCLSYYYKGLTEDQVRQCLQSLLKENDPGTEYQRWILRQQVNLEDAQSFHQILCPHLQYQNLVINFLLSRVVFPKEAKGFPSKLATSAWDIPSKPDQPLTTGFSDNRYLLPLSMPRKDLPDLLHTNAMVLEELLREENRHCVLAQNRYGHQLSVTELLRLIKNQDPSVQVIIDVGAQILESSIEDVAKTWLAMVPRNKAAAFIYFDTNDEAMVLDRDGHSERLLASPFRGQENLCLVFLDQHHSRGVDLKLPRNYRAAVTIGPRLTKDRLVQACHRMRELGNGQAVTFFVPPEVKHSINSEGNAAITSFEVIQWVIKQTCDQLEKLQPLWAWQGLNYIRCAQIWDMFRTGTHTLDDIIPLIQEAESKSLAQLYAPLTLYDAKAGGLLEIWENASSVATQLHEEQEREIVQEVQREQHVCRPPLVKPLEHHIDGDLKDFVVHGRFQRWYDSVAVRLAFKCISTTTAAQFNPPLKIHPKLYATVDFLDTIEQENDDQANDEFLESVHWVLSNTQDEMLLVISQYEANALLPSIRTSDKQARLPHNRENQSKIPIAPDLIQALGFFSGSLYFDNFNEYIDACNFFGFATDHSLDFPADAITSEGFVNEQAKNQVGWPVKCPFTTSPLLFLKSWYSTRTKGHGFSQCHIGSIVEARRLNAETFS
ncbi:uncharacterized protein BDV14DRAFT_201991 [Aspergillus stella-maris]|uniref:uncharacterized protein n=1 Tax=Aspergillus stella-maris TaxID=1810926 RepID=UPI003CCE3D37